jgi:hypothetical protein
MSGQTELHVAHSKPEAFTTKKIPEVNSGTVSRIWLAQLHPNPMNYSGVNARVS